MNIISSYKLSFSDDNMGKSRQEYHINLNAIKFPILYGKNKIYLENEGVYFEIILKNMKI